MNNGMELRFEAIAENEAFARMVISAYMMRLNPTVSALSEVRTAVSEAVTNAVVHAYGEAGGVVIMRMRTDGRTMTVEIEDEGRGIEDIEQAMQPFFTTQPDAERTGIGFALMQSFMDEVRVESEPGKGTRVTMKKTLGDDPA